MEIKQITASSDLPVSLSEARVQCSLTDSRHDSMLLSLIKSAAAYVESHTRARLCEQTVQFVSAGFPEVLPIYPVRSITEVAYTDPEGVDQVLAAPRYYATTGSIFPKLHPVDKAWPSVIDRPSAVRITALMGFESVPEDVKAAILIRVKEMFDRRGESVTGMSIAPSFIKITDLLAPHRMLYL